MGVSGWLAVAAAGGPLLAGVEAGVLGDVGVAGLAAVLALYMGVLCLYWLGKVVPAPEAAVVESSGGRAACSVSRPEPPAFAGEGVEQKTQQDQHFGSLALRSWIASRSTDLAVPRSWECKTRREPCWVWLGGNWWKAEGSRSAPPVSEEQNKTTSV